MLLVWHDHKWPESFYAANTLSIIGLCTTGAALLTSDDTKIEAIHPKPFNHNLTNCWYSLVSGDKIRIPCEELDSFYS